MNIVFPNVPNPAQRLQELRDSWPARVSFAEVRNAEPVVAKYAVTATAFTVIALIAGLFLAILQFGWPLTIGFAAPLQWLQPVLTWLCVLIVSLSFGLCYALIPLFWWASRGAYQYVFAKRQNLEYRLNDQNIEATGGVFLRAVRATHSTAAPAGDPLQGFAVKLSLCSRAAEVRAGTDMRIALIQERAALGGRKPFRFNFRVMTVRLPRSVPHLICDSSANGTMNSFVQPEQRVSLNTEFDQAFTTYAPAGYERDALEILTPDVMAGLLDYGSQWDIELHGEQLIVVSTQAGKHSDKGEITAMMLFAETVAGTISRQLQSYSDPRADIQREQVAQPGTTLAMNRLALGRSRLMLFGLLLLPLIAAYIMFAMR